MENDIARLLLRVKDNIDVVESGDVRDSLLDEVRADFLDLIELIKLFLISERDSYYGYFLMNMQFRVDFFQSGIAGIKLNEFPPVFVSNPLLLCKFSLKEIIFIVCHEIDHVVLNHPAEMIKANPEHDPEIFRAFNLAADAAVNDRIDHEIIAERHGFMSQPDGSITSSVLAKMFRLRNVRPMESYSYYFDLIKDKARQNGRASRNGQAEDKARGQGTGEKSEDSRKSSEKQVVTAANCAGKLSDHNWEAGTDVEDAAAVVREFVNAAVGMMNDESRALMPGHFMSEVERLNRPPELPWQAILKKYVGTITANKRKTRTRLNRRQPDRFDLSGSVDDKILKLVVAIDTSGSVNDRMIAQIFNEIFSILAKRKHEITVIECDAQVQRVYQAATPADVKTKVAGRGGTRFAPVIDYMNQNKYLRGALLIYFTDGYGEAKIPRPRTYRNMWVVIGGAANLSLAEPYGAVLSL